jgi:hypothetical protein
MPIHFSIILAFIVVLTLTSNLLLWYQYSQKPNVRFGSQAALLG